LPAPGAGPLSSSDSSEKYDRLAEGFSEREYADPARYSERRAQLFVDLGPRLAPGATVLDLGCGDGIMAGPITRHGLRYVGVDASEQMVEAARRRYSGIEFVASRQEDYTPPEPVEATLCLRAFYYPEDRVAFFRQVAAYTKVKFVFDFRQPEHSADSVLADVRAAGFTRIELRPFFTPQRRALPGIALTLLGLLERTGPLALLLSKRFGRVFCSASL
jgi:SAM-dependent methyltransferase